MFGNNELRKSMSRLGLREYMKPKRRLNRREEKLLRNAAMKLIYIIFTEIIHSFVTPIISCGHYLSLNISQYQASISTGTSVVM